MKSKEELLSEEVRTISDSGLKFLQWGVTLMISLQTALFFVRHEVANAAIEAGTLPKGSEAPLSRYLIGTSFLLFVALILSMLTARLNDQYRNYKSQLIECRKLGSGINDLSIKRAGRWAYYLYFCFPVIDLLARLIIKITVNLR